MVATNIFSGRLNRPAALGGPEALTKWTVMVVGALSEGPIRYNEIRRRVEGISQRMLTLTLKGLPMTRAIDSGDESPAIGTRSSPVPFKGFSDATPASVQSA